MVSSTIKSQLLIALTILYAQLFIGIISSCMFNKMRSIRLVKKKGETRSPSLQKIYFPVTCLPDRPPRNHRGAWGRTPMHGKFYRGHARYACRRTPRQTSGLPAGAELHRSKIILAFTTKDGRRTVGHRANDHTPVVPFRVILWHGQEHSERFPLFRSCTWTMDELR